MPPPSHPYVELRRLQKSFAETAVLRELSLELDEGEILALLGPSGSGKTTALRLLAGFEIPDRGTIHVAGRDVTRLAPAARGFGMVFQHYALFPHMTVAENVAFGLETRGVEPARRAERVREMLRLVDLEGFGARRVSAISGGQQQRVALARALAPSPAVLLLDEPLSNLDPALRERTRRELRAAVRQVGITTVLVTHEQEEAFHVGDRVAVLHHGRLQQLGRPEELYRSPANRFVATFVGRASVLAGTLVERADPGVLVDLGAARWRVAAAVPVETDAGEAVDVVLRPESLRLVEPGTPDALRGRLAERRFLGALAYGQVELEAGGEVEVLLDGAAEAGSAVGVARRPETAGACWAFRREERR